MLAKRLSIASLALTGAIFFSWASEPAFAQEPYYKGKSIRIIVGFAAGGGFDAYARALSRHMGKHIPGSPTVIVENMTGAGSLVAANYLYKVAKPDGLTIGTFHGSQVVAQLIGGQGIEFDARKLEWIGTPGKNHDVCLLSKASGITSVEQWLAAKPPVRLGGSAPGSSTDDFPKILRAVLGLPLRIVTGYKGTADMRIAVEGGEISGLCGISAASVRATWRKQLEAGEVTIVLQNAPQPHPDLPSNIPLAINLAKTEEGRQLINSGIHAPSAITYAFSAPPGTPQDRIRILRRAFWSTTKDPEFLAEASKANLDVNSIQGEEVAKLISDLFRLDPRMVTRLKDLLHELN
ncbi:MAG: Bug family tripartite tricarboxylate transporter substrate binding protein [Alphaproteobacteria bacterium]